MSSAFRAAVLAGALALAACASTPGGDASSPAQSSEPRLKHVVMPIKATPELAEHPVVLAFEQVFCSELFAMNDKQVVCPDDVRTIIRIEQERAALGGGEPLPMERLEAMTRAPRRIGLSVTQAGQVIRVESVLQDESGLSLVRDQVELSFNGENVSERARELARRVLASRG